MTQVQADTNPFSQLPPSILAVLQAQGITTPTAIQTASFQPIFEGRDVIAQSRTGSGKTLAFGLPAFLRLQQDKSVILPRMLVLTPTRELAEQLTQVFQNTFGSHKFKTVAITGGQSYFKQTSALKQGVDVVIGTPGRIADLMQQKVLKLDKIEIFVLDEMDEMLDFGFADEILKIKDAMGKKVQTLLFSATFPPKVTAIARKVVDNPFEVKVPSQDTSTGTIEHSYIYVKSERNLDALLSMLLFYDPDHSIIFCKTRDETKNICHVLSERGVSVGMIHGEMSQFDRSKTLERFKSKAIKVLVATDVAARGIDVNNLTHVINYNVPTSSETYTHRAGRTGRAGATGKTWTIVSPRDARNYSFIIQKCRIKPVSIEIPSSQTISDKLLVNLISSQKVNGNSLDSRVEESISRYLDSVSFEESKQILGTMLKNQMSKAAGSSLKTEDFLLPAGKMSQGSGGGSSHRSGSYDRDRGPRNYGDRPQRRDNSYNSRPSRGGQENQGGRPSRFNEMSYNRPVKKPDFNRGKPSYYSNQSSTSNTSKI